MWLYFCVAVSENLYSPLFPNIDLFREKKLWSSFKIEKIHQHSENKFWYSFQFVEYDHGDSFSFVIYTKENSNQKDWIKILFNSNSNKIPIIDSIKIESKTVPTVTFHSIREEMEIYFCECKNIKRFERIKYINKSR